MNDQAPEQIEDDLRDQVRAWIAAGHSQVELSRLSGVSQHSLSQWLAEKHRTRLVVAARVAAAIGRPLRMGGRKR